MPFGVVVVSKLANEGVDFFDVVPAAVDGFRVAVGNIDEFEFCTVENEFVGEIRVKSVNEFKNVDGFIGRPLDLLRFIRRL